MNYKETKAPLTTVTYDKDIIESQTENIYEAISIISKRAVQINTDLKTEMSGANFCNMPADANFLWVLFFHQSTKRKTTTINGIIANR